MDLFRLCVRCKNSYITDNNQYCIDCLKELKSIEERNKLKEEQERKEVEEAKKRKEYLYKTYFKPLYAAAKPIFKNKCYLSTIGNDYVLWLDTYIKTYYIVYDKDEGILLRVENSDAQGRYYHNTVDSSGNLLNIIAQIYRFKDYFDSYKKYKS